MKRLSNFLTIFMISTSMSCNILTDKEKTEHKYNALLVKSEIKLTDNEIIGEKVKSEGDSLKPSDCVRGPAEPIIKKNIFPNSNFILQSDSLSGIELVKFDNGDKLIIENMGCEYFSLNFRFESSRFIADTTDTKYWADKALKLIKETEHGIDAPVDLKNGIKAFANYISKTERPKLLEESDYGLNDIRYFVYLNRIQKINNSKFAIELTFSVGPL